MIGTSLQKWFACVIQVALECDSASYVTFTLGLTWARIPPHLEVFEVFVCLDKSKTAQTMAARANPGDWYFPLEVVCVSSKSLWNAFRRLNATFALGLTWARIPLHSEVFEVFVS